MPFLHRGCDRTADTYLSQPSPKVSGLHLMPCGDSWVQHGSCVFQAIEETTVHGTKNIRSLQISAPNGLKYLLVVALLVFLLPAATAQEEEQKSVAQGNYNVKH